MVLLFPFLPFFLRNFALARRLSAAQPPRICLPWSVSCALWTLEAAAFGLPLEPCLAL